MNIKDNGISDNMLTVVLINGEEGTSGTLPSNQFYEVSNGGTTHICTLYSEKDTANYPTRDSFIKKFDNNSWYFSSVESNGILVGSNVHEDWSIGDKDFTLDFWEYNSNSFITAGVQSVYMAGSYLDSNNYWSVVANIAGGSPNGIMTMHFIVVEAGVTLLDINFLPGSTLDTWVHYAVVKLNSTISFYMNGVLQDSNTLATLPVISAGLQVGAFDIASTGGSYDRQMRIDEFRFSKGIARWTSDFTVSNRAY